MAQISYGSITITDVSDGQPGAQGASVEKVEIEYYRRLSGAAAPTEQSTGSATIPDYIDGCTYYTRSVTYLDDNGQHITVKGQWIEDTALTAETQKAYEAWVNAAEAATKTARLIYSEVRTDDRDAGLAVVGGITTSKSQYGYNTIMAPTYLGLRYNDINLSKLTTNGLEFYYPTLNNGIPVQGQKGLEIGPSSLTLYKFNQNSNDPLEAAAVLDTTGLNITDGSIILGEEIISYYLSRDGSYNANKTYYEFSYALTSDITVNSSKVYYTRTGSGTTINPYVYTVVENPTGNPSSQSWYEDHYTIISPVGDTSNISPKEEEYYEKRDVHAFEVDSEGFLNAQAGWIGGAESYVKLEKDVNTDARYLDVRLSKLDMKLPADLYGQENIIDALGLISQQTEFVKWWNGEEIYLDTIDDNTYEIYEFTDIDTGRLHYFYNLNQFEEGDYEASSDSTVDDTKEYFKPSMTGESSGSIIQLENYGDLNIKDLTVEINATQEGSGDPSPSNRRAINGFINVKIVRTNENLAGDNEHNMHTAADGVVTSSTYNSTILRIKQGQTYVIKQESSDTATYGFFYGYPRIGDVTYNNSRTVVTAQTFTFNAPIDGYALIRPNYTNSIVSINKGTTALTTAKNTEIYNVSLSSVVYGGTLDVTSGVLTVTHAYIDLGDYTWIKDTTYKRFYTDQTAGVIATASATTVKPDIISTAFETVSFNAGYSHADVDGVIFISGAGYLAVRWLDHANDSVGDFKTAVTGIKAVCKLVTPLTYNLVPREISLVDGTNYIWANSGNLTIEPTLDYQQASPSTNPETEGFYEFIVPVDNWQEYEGDVSTLPSIDVAGLGRSLNFTDDSLGNRQKLVVSSSRHDILEKTTVEIDPQFISFLIQSDNSSTLELNVGYNNESDTAEIKVKSGDEAIFSVEDDYNYMLNTTTGIKIGPLGLFHYKDGLAIGLV